MLPFSPSYKESEDLALINETFEGSSKALNELINRHQRFIFNLALKFVADEDDAADLTQEVLITMVTKLKQFQGKSDFRTWLYKLVYNRFLNSKRKNREVSIVSFEEHTAYIDELHNDEEMSQEEQLLREKEIDWTRNRCLSGMLLCLDREQRMVYILGAIFNLKSTLAADILEITPENFRKQLQRAKADVATFVQDKCGLINPSAPCRCHKKTKGFIKDGTVSPESIQFYRQHTESIASLVEEKNRKIDSLIENEYLYLFTEQPYEDRKNNEMRSRSILNDPVVQQLFHLN
ncbi:RNA polymerase sigma factor [Mucilaginibacter sp. SG564]|uniref:RNA polymerase sigma factor n=1 Tax=Mucilaginibacter sp. SG564 TaxID=2587022 RepID=UPI001556EACB|nr:RNA polymerase sigma factor [Mucilaginibacter sp. SG564]NOW96017.1 RNA polymerase sigma factor (sigma-70 family) [Mucilaginibacter sp. SG564]